MHFPTFCSKSWLITHFLPCWKIFWFMPSPFLTDAVQDSMQWTPGIQQLKHSWCKTMCSANTDCVQISHPGSWIQDCLEDMASVWWRLLTVSHAKMVWWEIVCDTSSMGIFLRFGVDSSPEGCKHSNPAQSEQAGGREVRLHRAAQHGSIHSWCSSLQLCSP